MKETTAAIRAGRDTFSTGRAIVVHPKILGPRGVEGDVLKCIRLDIQPRLDLLGQGL